MAATNCLIRAQDAEAQAEAAERRAKELQEELALRAQEAKVNKETQVDRGDGAGTTGGREPGLVGQRMGMCVCARMHVHAITSTYAHACGKMCRRVGLRGRLSTCHDSSAQGLASAHARRAQPHVCSHGPLRLRACRRSSPLKWWGCVRSWRACVPARSCGRSSPRRSVRSFSPSCSR